MSSDKRRIYYNGCVFEEVSKNIASDEFCIFYNGITFKKIKECSDVVHERILKYLCGVIARREE